MKLVIDIPETIYEHIKNTWRKRRGSCPESNIAWGTPLPKHHGRLKDVDAFISKVKADREHSAYLRSWTADDVLNALDNSYVPTIIEAECEDKE